MARRTHKEIDDQVTENLTGSFYKAVGKASVFLTKKRTIGNAKKAAKNAAKIFSRRPPKATTRAAAVAALKAGGVYFGKKAALPVALAGAGVGAYYLKTKIRRKAKRLDREDHLTHMEKRYKLDYKQARKMKKLTKENASVFSDMVEERLSGELAADIVERKFGVYLAKKAAQKTALVGGVVAAGVAGFAAKKAIGHSYRKKRQDREYMHAKRMKGINSAPERDRSEY